MSEPYTIAVITRVPDLHRDPGATGNLYDPILWRGGDQASKENDWRPTVTPFIPALVGVQLKMENFALGEILILDAYGREIGGNGRKPAKWDVTCEGVATIEQAIELARQVTS